MVPVASLDHRNWGITRMSFASALPQDPWAAVLDWLLAHGYADETITGDINNKKAFALETLVGPSGKVGLSYVHRLGAGQPTEADIYAYWLRVARVSGMVELRTFSRDTGYHDRVTVAGSIGQALDALEREIAAANVKHTERRKRGESAPRWPGEWMEFEMTPAENPMFVAPSPELRFALAFFYDKVGGQDLRRLSSEQKRELMANVKTGMRQVQQRQAQGAMHHQSSDPGCFVACTPVETPEGPQPISSVEAGDVVLGVGKDGLGWFRVRSVRTVAGFPIEIETNRGLLRVTADHRLIGPAGSTPAGKLAPGSLLLTAGQTTGEGYAVVLDVRPGGSASEQCYNLYLDGASTFIAGSVYAGSFGRFPAARARWTRLRATFTSLMAPATVPQCASEYR